MTIAGEDKNLLLVIGVGIDSDRITKKLRRKVGHAEVVELRTVDAAAVADDLVGGRVIAAEHAYRYHASPSPYKHHHSRSGAHDRTTCTGAPAAGTTATPLVAQPSAYAPHFYRGARGYPT